MPVKFLCAERDGKSSVVEVDCYRSLNLLAHAQMEELDVGSDCGGHGICGRDRVQWVRGKVSAVTEIEKSHLNRRLLDQGWRLACQCFPESDQAEIEVRVPLVEKDRAP